MEELRKNLTRIKELTNIVTPYNSLFGEEKQNGDIIKNDFILEYGKGEIIGLLNIPEIAIARVKFAPNTLFPFHKHPEYEVFVVFKGFIKVIVNNEEFIIRRGMNFEIFPNTGHCVQTENEECELIVITIPANMEFPNA